MDFQLPRSRISQKKPPGHGPSERQEDLVRTSFFRKFSYFLGIGILFVGIWSIVLVLAICLWFIPDLPTLQTIGNTKRHTSITVLAEDLSVLATYGDVYGNPVPAKELPPHVIHAFLAAEDRRFYHHYGIDGIGLIRAMVVNYRAGTIVQGGSTITQQLAKHILQAEGHTKTYDRSYVRKIKEALLALKLEYHLTKDQILTYYLNRVYFGGGTYGLDGATERYFDKHPKDLTVYEAAMLAGLLKAPSRYSPGHNSGLTEKRAKQILLNMVDAGFLSQKGMDAAIAIATPLPERAKEGQVHYFTDWIADIVYALFPDYEGDLVVHSTLCPSLQALVQEKATLIMEDGGKKWGANQIACVLMNAKGEVKALLGGSNYRKSQFNCATQALRQTGSVFKYFTYLTAFQEHIAFPDTMIEDTPFVHGSWAPSNYLYKAKGVVPLKDAFAWSANAPAIRLAERVGIHAIIRMARRLGITSPLPENLTLALGSGEASLLELTGAMAVIPNQGRRVIPYGIKVIRTKQGKNLYQGGSAEEVVLDAHAVSAMKTLLGAVLSYGTGRKASLGRGDEGAKTGTSQHHRDIWCVGYAGPWVVGTWLGCSDGTPLKRLPGGAPSGQLWKQVLEGVFALEKETMSPETQTLPDLVREESAAAEESPEVDALEEMLD